MNFIENESKQKLRGGYYTPLDLATFLVRWIQEINPKNILEPSCGDGVFFEAMSKVGGFKKSKTTAFEIDKIEAAKARKKSQQGLIKSQINPEDFLKWALEHFDDQKTCFDAVIGNPPFIRYQYLPELFQQRTEQIFGKTKLPFTKHTNAWVPFIVASIALLRPGGRLAMIVPSEIIHIIHAQSLRAYLGTECRRLVIIDPEEIWFKDTLQGAVILLAEKRHNALDKAEGVGIYPVKGREFLNLNPSKVFSTPIPINGKTIQGKWTRALLDLEGRSLLDELTEHPDVYNFEEIAQVDVGIVTGANDFFLVSDEVVKNSSSQTGRIQCLEKSGHCPGIIYDEEQQEKNVKKGDPTNFIWFPDEAAANNDKAQKYIEYGKKQNLHTRYKCRTRKLWYSVPSVYATEIGMLKRSHGMPRLILNKIKAFTTDTAYRIRTRNVVASRLVGSFINPLTALSAELEGRHYGGGVLELVPSEIERLMIPISQKSNIDLIDLDNDIQELSTEKVLEKHGGKILNTLKISKQKQEKLLESWQKLCRRRQRISSIVETS